MRMPNDPWQASWHPWARQALLAAGEISRARVGRLGHSAGGWVVRRGGQGRFNRQAARESAGVGVAGVKRRGSRRLICAA